MSSEQPTPRAAHDRGRAAGPRGGVRAVVALFAALALSACAASGDGQERFPTPEDYPASTMQRFTFEAGEGGWRLAGLRTPNPAAPWRLVVVTGTPSWSDYWAPTLAAAGPDLEVVVADRPGFGRSEPREAVTDIAAQARALAPLLEVAPGRKVVLLGQSYGAPVATLLAAQNPDKVQGLVLASGYFGTKGPTARTLTGVGAATGWLLPRDLKNSLAEVRSQPKQIGRVRETLAGLALPVAVVHGTKDTFVPVATAERLARDKGAAFVPIEGGDHFLNACCVDALLGAVDGVIAEARLREIAGEAAAR